MIGGSPVSGNHHMEPCGNDSLPPAPGLPRGIGDELRLEELAHTWEVLPYGDSLAVESGGFCMKKCWFHETWIKAANVSMSFSSASWCHTADFRDVRQFKKDISPSPERSNGPWRLQSTCSHCGRPTQHRRFPHLLVGRSCSQHRPRLWSSAVRWSLEAVCESQPRVHLKIQTKMPYTFSRLRYSYMYINIYIYREREISR